MNTTATIQIHYEPNAWQPEYVILETTGPFVSVRLSPTVSLMSRSPGDLRKLAQTLADAARDLANAAIEDAS